MSIINKILSFFSKKKPYREPAGIWDLDVNRYGQLVQWKDAPGIVDGIYYKENNIIGMHISDCTGFTIVKNSFKGL